MKIIWHDTDGEYFDAGINIYRQFRKSFVLADVDQANHKVKIICSGQYLLYINDTYIGRGPGRYDRRWPSYDTIDVSTYVNSGLNTVAILCLYQGYGTGQSMVSPPGLSFELTRSDGGNPHQQVICSDETWKSSQALAFNDDAPRINGRQGNIEIFDARKDKSRWMSPEYDDRDWLPVKILKHELRVSHFWNLSPRDIPLLHEAKTPALQVVANGWGKAALLPPADKPHQLWTDIKRFLDQASLCIQHCIAPEDAETEIPEHSAILKLYECSKLYAGYLHLDITGHSGQIVDCIYMEMLPPSKDGKLVLDGLITSENRPMDRFILREGRNRLEVAFGWKAFRYVLLIVHPSPGKPVIHEVSILTREYPFKQTGNFSSSDPELNAIFEICKHTARICAQDAFVDSPSREQQQWIGDGRWTALVYFHLTGDSRLYRRMLVQIGQSQDYTGMIKPRHPDDHNNIPPIPAFALSWIAAFYEYYLHTGDLQTPGEWWSNIEHCLSWFAKHENSDGLLSDVPGWFFIDWGKPPETMDIKRGGLIAALNLQYIEALLYAAELSSALDKPDRAQALRKKASLLQDRCRKIFWNTDLGAYTDCVVEAVQSQVVSEQTNSLALLYLHGNGPLATINRNGENSEYPERIPLIMENVFQRAWQPQQSCKIGSPVPCSPFYMIRLLQALSRHNQHQLALQLLKARYKIFLEAGSTTTWEKWSLYRFDEKNNLHTDSACHGWGSTPILFFITELLGLKPLRPGYLEYQFQPQCCNIDFLRGELSTPSADLKMFVSPKKKQLWRA